MKLIKSEVLISGELTEHTRVKAKEVDIRLVETLIKELINQGFIKFTEHPQPNNMKHRAASLFIMPHAEMHKMKTLLMQIEKEFENCTDIEIPLELQKFFTMFVGLNKLLKEY